MSASDSDQESINSSSSEEGKIWKLGSDDLLNFNNSHSRKKLNNIQNGFQIYMIALMLITTIYPYALAL